MPPTETAPASEGHDAPETAEESTAAEESPAGERRALIGIAAVVLLVCGGLVTYGILDTKDEPKRRVLPTAEVTYEVQGEGTVQISYLAGAESGAESGDATVETGVRPPWKKTVRVPLGKNPTVNIVLDAKGGQADCTLAVRGEHVQRALASGAYGRATCTGELPTPVATDESTG